MSSFEERLADVETEVIRLRERQADTHTLAAHADRDVAEFRAELRAQTRLLNATRLDMAEIRQAGTRTEAELGELRAEMRAGFQALTRLLEGLNGGQSGDNGDA